MHILEIISMEKDFTHKWPGGEEQIFSNSIIYRVRASAGVQEYKIGYGEREAYEQIRKHIVVWINNKVQAEFNGADDFEITGEVLSEIRVPGKKRDRMCRYGQEVVPERYASLPVVALKSRIENAHDAWAIVVNIADHRQMCLLAALRRIERSQVK